MTVGGQAANVAAWVAGGGLLFANSTSTSALSSAKTPLRGATMVPAEGALGSSRTWLSDWRGSRNQGSNTKR